VLLEVRGDVHRRSGFRCEPSWTPTIHVLLAFHFGPTFSFTATRLTIFRTYPELSKKVYRTLTISQSIKEKTKKKESTMKLNLPTGWKTTKLPVDSDNSVTVRGVQVPISWSTVCLLLHLTPLHPEGGEDHRVCLADIGVRNNKKYPAKEDVEESMLQIAAQPDLVQNSNGLTLLVHGAKGLTDDQGEGALKLFPEDHGVPSVYLYHATAADALELVEALEKPTGDVPFAQERPDALNVNDPVELIGYALYLLDTMGVKERWGRAMRWRDEGYDLSIYPQLSGQEVFFQTHLALSQKANVCLSPTEAVSRLVAIYCAMSGKFCHFDYPDHFGKKEIQAAVDSVKDREEAKPGVTLFTISGAKVGDARPYLPQEVAQANAVGLMRQRTLENIKQMNACEKFTRFGQQLSVNPEHVAPWSTGTGLRDYADPLFKDALNLFWREDVSVPSTVVDARKTTMVGLMGALKGACLRLTEQRVRRFDCPKDRYRYVAIFVPRDMAVRHLDDKFANWRSADKATSMTENSHKQNALIAISCAYTFGFHSFVHGHITSDLSEFQTNNGSWSKKWTTWQSQNQVKERELIESQKGEELNKLGSTTQRDVNLLEYIEFAEELAERYLMPIATMSECVDGNDSRDKWSQYCFLAALFRDLAKLYHLIRTDSMAAAATKHIPVFMYYLCELHHRKKLTIFLDRTTLGKGQLAEKDNKGSRFYPGAHFSNVRIMVCRVPTKEETTEMLQPQPTLLTDIVRRPPTWLLDCAEGNKKLIPILSVAMGEDWRTAEYDQVAIFGPEPTAVTQKKNKPEKSAQTPAKASGEGDGSSPSTGTARVGAGEQSGTGGVVVTPDPVPNAQMGGRSEKDKNPPQNLLPFLDPPGGAAKAPTQTTSSGHESDSSGSESFCGPSKCDAGHPDRGKIMLDPVAKQCYSERQCAEALRLASVVPDSETREEREARYKRRQQALFRCNHFTTGCFMDKKDDQGRYERRPCVMTYHGDCKSHEEINYTRSCRYCRSPIHAHNDNNCHSLPVDGSPESVKCAKRGQSAIDCIEVNRLWQLEHANNERPQNIVIWPPVHPSAETYFKNRDGGEGTQEKSHNVTCGAGGASAADSDNDLPSGGGGSSDHNAAGVPDGGTNNGDEEPLGKRKGTNNEALEIDDEEPRKKPKTQKDEAGGEEDEDEEDSSDDEDSDGDSEYLPGSNDNPKPKSGERVAKKTGKMKYSKKLKGKVDLADGARTTIESLADQFEAHKDHDLKVNLKIAFRQHKVVDCVKVLRKIIEADVKAKKAQADFEEATRITNQQEAEAAAGPDKEQAGAGDVAELGKKDD